MNPNRRSITVFSIIASGVCLLAGAAAGQVPPTESSPVASQAQVKQSAIARPKPQIIYNLSSASRETAEALHAQAKADMSLSIDSSMPISLQLARANANAAAAAAQAVAELPQPTATPQQRASKPSVKPNKPFRRVRAGSRPAAVPQAVAPAMPKK